MEPWLAGAIPQVPDVKVNVCNTILFDFHVLPSCSPLNTNSLSLTTNLTVFLIKSNKFSKKSSSNTHRNYLHLIDPLTDKADYGCRTRKNPL
jgi:hypothetical protein